VRPPTVLKAVLYGLVVATFGLLADFVVNVATGGSLPGPLDRYRSLAWPAVILVFVASLVAAVVDRLRHREPGTHVVPDAAPAPSSPPQGLPRAIDEFTGREKELDELRKLVPVPESHKPLAPVVANIYGPAGAGKSTLVIRFARELVSRYPDAQLYVNLQAVATPPLEPVDALSRLVRALGVRGRDLPTDQEALSSLYRAHLEGKRAIVVLDHAASESQVRPLLPGIPSCLVLVTSQQPLDELIGSRKLRLGVMCEDDAVALLERVAGDHMRSLGQAEAVKQVAELCGNLPLALSIAGVLLRRHGRRPLSELIAQLTDKRGGLLERFHMGELDVRVGFDVGYDHLSRREQTLFRRLRLLPEPTFGAEMAAAVLNSSRDEAEQLLRRLVDEQMLEQVGDQRYALQNLIGVYAEERLEEEEPQRERQAALGRALRLYVEETVRQAALLDPSIVETGGGRPDLAPTPLDEQLAALDWFERERANLVTVSRRAVEMQAHDIAWRLAASLLPFFDLRGHWGEWTEVQDAALRSARAGGGIHAQVWIELGCGYLQWLRGRHDRAHAHLEEALEMAMAGRLRRLEARTRHLMGRLAQDRGQLGDALVCYGRAANMFHDEDLLHDQISTHFDIAMVLHEQEQLSVREVLHLGESVLDSMAEMPRELWLVRSIGRIKDYLGHVTEMLGDLECAGTYYIGSSEAFQEIGFRHGYGHTRRALGQVRMKQGSLERAAAFLDESIAIFRTIGDRHNEGSSLLLAGDTQDRLGNREEARRCWQDALTALSDAGVADLAEARSRLQSPPE
jgi:tetratricopeptide (TPR) repeat protein